MRHTEIKYAWVVLVMVFFLATGLCTMEQITEHFFVPVFFFCMVCFGIIFFTLIKAGAMDFPENSIFAQLEKRCNAKEGRKKLQVRRKTTGKSHRAVTSHGTTCHKSAA